MPEYKFSYEEYNSANQLAEDKQQLLTKAIKSCEKAYAPYSNFKVGCAVQMNDGQIIVGSNVENASYPVGICAERTALAHATSNFPESIVTSMAIAYTAANASNEVIFPCGMCRQFILEMQSKSNTPIELILTAPDGKIIVVDNAEHLIPFGFKGDLL